MVGEAEEREDGPDSERTRRRSGSGPWLRDRHLAPSVYCSRVKGGDWRVYRAWDVSKQSRTKRESNGPLLGPNDQARARLSAADGRDPGDTM